MSGVNTMHKGWWVGENSEGRPSGSVVGVGCLSMASLMPDFQFSQGCDPAYVYHRALQFAQLGSGQLDAGLSVSTVKCVPAYLCS